jgi:glycosyltransferase involved in cell wall biosynthesis
MAKALMSEGLDVTVLCRYGIHGASDGIDKEGYFEGVHYIYCSGTSIRPEGYLKRNFLKFKGLFNEIRFYLEFSRNHSLEGALISTNKFYNVLFYFVLGKIFEISTVIDTVEYWTSNKEIRGWKRLDKYFYDKFYFRFADSIICISDFLINKVSISKRRNLIKIPSITDFDKFTITGNNQLIKGKYFLFCGSKAYSDIIDFLVLSFEILNYEDVKLVLVTENTEILINRIKNSPRKDNILVKTNIAYKDLVNLYCYSQALIIPMRNTDQDKARFPHKISEYCAAKRPIITNRVGEISNYFSESNSYLCEDYDKKEYAEAMQKVISDPLKASGIAVQSYETGLTHFNYKSYSKSLANLFNN